MEHTTLGEGLVTNIDFYLFPNVPQAVYFIQTGGSALSNAYNVGLQYSHIILRS